MEEKYFITLISLFAFFILLYMNYVDYNKDHKLRYICRQMGDYNNPDYIIGWLLIIFILHYTLLFHPNIKKEYVYASFFVTTALIIFANLDYMNREDQRKPSVYSSPHYLFTILAYIILILILYKVYGFNMIIPIIFLVLIYIYLHYIGISYLENREKYLKYSVALELGIVIFILGALTYAAVSHLFK